MASDYINRCNAYDDADQFDKSMAVYDTALKLKPDGGKIFYNRDITYEHKKMLKQARAEFIAACRHGLRTSLLYDRLVVYGLLKSGQQPHGHDPELGLPRGMRSRCSVQCEWHPVEGRS